MLKIEIFTNDCADGESYQHTIPIDSDKVEVMKAIDVLYAHLIVWAINIEVVDKEHEDA